MMRDGGDADGDAGRQNVEDAPIAVERGQDVRGGMDPDLVATSNGGCVQCPRGMPEPKTPPPDVVARHNLTHLLYAS